MTSKTTSNVYTFTAFGWTRQIKWKITTYLNFFAYDADTFVAYSGKTHNNQIGIMSDLSIDKFHTGYFDRYVPECIIFDIENLFRSDW